MLTFCSFIFAHCNFSLLIPFPVGSLCFLLLIARNSFPCRSSNHHWLCVNKQSWLILLVWVLLLGQKNKKLVIEWYVLHWCLAVVPITVHYSCRHFFFYCGWFVPSVHGCEKKQWPSALIWLLFTISFYGQCMSHFTNILPVRGDIRWSVKLSIAFRYPGVELGFQVSLA